MKQASLPSVPLIGLSAAGRAAGEAALVREGRARAILVTADEPARVAVYAAGEMARHVELATGVKLEIAAESSIPGGYESRVFIGDTAAARALGIDPDELARDEFILRVAGADLYVLGREDRSRDRLMSGPPERRVLPGGFTGSTDGSREEELSSPNGTLFGVYEILQRFAGIRWLWPGESGTYAPRATTLVIPGPLDERHPPKLAFRVHYWTAVQQAADRAARGEYNGHQADPGGGRRRKALEQLSFSAGAVQAYRDDLDVFLARHRLGLSAPMPPTHHYFSGWWPRHGKAHPDWFMMREDGGRGPRPGGNEQHVAMCVSNPGLHRYIVEKHWDGGDYIGLGEVDARVFCRCPDCLAWDQPQDHSFPRGVQTTVYSDRYARFWKTIAGMAAERNPDVTVTTYLYWNYMPHPRGDIRLDRRIYGEFVPWSAGDSFYPMGEEVDRWVREQWLGWRETGIRLAYRPNIFHGGYVAPYLSTRQAGEFFRFAAANGMEGFCFDSLYGHWATRGPMLYMYMRLAWDPALEIGQVRDEFFSAFGPAAAAVEEYFDYFEDYSARVTEHLFSPVPAWRAYPPAVLEKGAEILARALEAARTDPDQGYAGRVAFLQAGLENARLSLRLVGALQGEAPSTGAPEVKECIIGGTPGADADAPGGSMERGRWGRWEFRADPNLDGLREGWYNRPGDESGRWHEIEVPGHWVAVAGDYLGYGWYRTTFRLPPDSDGRPVELHFGAVDEQAWVYVNGRYAGEHTVASERRGIGMLYDQPFSVTVPAGLLDPEGENRLVVLVHASVGAAGIWRPLTARFADEERAAPDAAAETVDPKQAFEELVAFRRAHEHLYFADLLDAAGREIRWLDWEAMPGEPE